MGVKGSADSGISRILPPGGRADKGMYKYCGLGREMAFRHLFGAKQTGWQWFCCFPNHIPARRLTRRNLSSRSGKHQIHTPVSGGRGSLEILERWFSGADTGLTLAGAPGSPGVRLSSTPASPVPKPGIKLQGQGGTRPGGTSRRPRGRDPGCGSAWPPSGRSSIDRPSLSPSPRWWLQPGRGP